MLSLEHTLLIQSAYLVDDHTVRYTGTMPTSSGSSRLMFDIDNRSLDSVREIFPGSKMYVQGTVNAGDNQHLVVEAYNFARMTPATAHHGRMTCSGTVCELSDDSLVVNAAEPGFNTLQIGCAVQCPPAHLPLANVGRIPVGSLSATSHPWTGAPSLKDRPSPSRDISRTSPTTFQASKPRSPFSERSTFGRRLRTSIHAACSTPCKLTASYRSQ